MPNNQKRITANRKNAQHSTGPITEEGKATASRNSFRHGLTACAMTMLHGEIAQDYMDFGNGLRAEHNPTTITEDALVTKMIESLWLSARAVKLQQSLFLLPKFRRQDLDLYMRYQTMHDRAFTRAVADLLKLRQAAHAQQTGSVSQTQKQELHIAKVRHLNTRTEATELDMQIRKTRTAPSSTDAPVMQM